MAAANEQPIRAGLYLRLSKLKDTSMTSLERQEVIDRTVCAELGWEPVEVYSDEGRSAFNRQTRRKGFDDMIADAKRGHINALVTVADDRFSRNERDALVLLDLADERGVRLATNTDRWDLRTATGRRHFRASMNDAIFSSERQSERTRLG